MVSAGCSTVVSVRLLFNMHFINIDLLGGTGLTNVSFGAWEQLPSEGSLPKERGLRTMSADLLPHVDSHCSIGKGFF